VLVDEAGTPPGDVGRAHVRQALEALRGQTEIEDVARALHVDSLRGLDGHREVVERGQMEHLRHLRAQALVVLPGEPEPALCDVAREQLDPAGIQPAGGLPGGVERPRLDQGHEPRLGIPLEQVGGEPATDEPGEAGEKDEGDGRTLRPEPPRTPCRRGLDRARGGIPPR